MSDPDWRQLPPLTTLRAFEATARLGGYSAAARALNVTPAAIAQQVRKLEAEVGAALVRREGRGLALSEAGEQLAQPLREGFGLIAASVENLRRREESRGVLVSTTEYFVDAVILPNLRDFWDAHPGVGVAFTPEGNRAPLVEEAFDIFVRAARAGEERHWTQFDIVPLIETPVILCGAPSLVGDGQVNPAELPWLRENGMPAAYFEHAVREAGCDPDAIRIVDPGDGKFEIEAALMGYGLSVSSELVMRKYLAEGSLVRVGTLEIAGSYWMITKPGPMRDNVRRFADWLTGICAPMNYDGGAKRRVETMA